MWDIKHKSGTLLFTTSDESVADNRRTMGWVVEMKKLTIEKAQELIEQLSQGERSCREEYYLQALEDSLRLRNAEAIADVVEWTHPNEERKCDIRMRKFEVSNCILYRLPETPL